MKKVFFTLSLLCLSSFFAVAQTGPCSATYATLPYSQDFESWVNQCDSLDAPDLNWTNTPATGDNSWRRDDQGMTTGGWDNQNDPENYTAYHGNHYARFNIWASNGDIGDLDLHLNCSSAQASLLTFYYVNQELNDNMAVYLSTDGGSTFTQIGYYTTANNWTQTSLVINSSSPQTVIRFSATSDWQTFDIGLDSLNVIALANCSGTPSLSGLSATDTYSYGVPYTSIVSIGPLIDAGGITYQWQSSPDSVNWTNISVAGAYDTIDVTSTIYYRVYAICTNSNLADTTAGLKLELQPYAPCDGIPTVGTLSATQIYSAGIPYTSSLSMSATSGLEVTGITYQWQSSSDSVNWVNVVGATDSIYTANVAATIYYRLYVACTNSGLADTTAGIKLQLQTSSNNPVYEQNNSVWVFGENAGLDFNSGTAIPVQTSMNDAFSAYGSVCDASGQLLFYTDGDTVYNKYGQIMPNGAGITGLPYFSNFSISPVAAVTQGVLIVPIPDSAGKYYLFSTSSNAFSSFYGSTDSTLFGRLYYSVIDMSLNNGIGDIEQGRKGIVFDSGIIGGITGVQGNDCNIWLLYRTLPHFQFKAYSISPTGIAANPIVSGDAFNYTFTSSNMPGSYLAVSPNHQKLASVIQLFNYGPNFISGYLQVFDFDTTTGIVSSSNVTMDFSNDPIEGILKSVCFSPDNSKLYATTRFNTYLNQFDMSNLDSAAFAGSETYVGDCYEGSELRLAPDGKIYFIYDNSDMGYIGSPNLDATACAYTSNAIQSVNGTEFSLSNFGGLPNIVPAVQEHVTINSTDTAIASGNSISAPQGYVYYQWNNGTTNAAEAISVSGTYWVTYYNYYCDKYVDTFHVIANEGVPAINGATIKIYPNPAQTEIIVDINNVASLGGTIQIVNVLGQVVLQQPCNQSRMSINVSSLGPGTYILNYIDKNNGVTKLRTHILISR